MTTATAKNRTKKPLLDNKKPIQIDARKDNEKASTPRHEMLYYAERYGGLNPNRARELYALIGDFLER